MSSGYSLNLVSDLLGGAESGEFGGSYGQGYAYPGRLLNRGEDAIQGSVTSMVDASTPEASMPRGAAQGDAGQGAAEAALGSVRDSYAGAEQDALVGRLRGQGNVALEGARDPSQQRANYAYQDWNLAKSNPRGNLNNRPFATTERFSRLADLLNNQVYFDPGGAGGVFNAATGTEAAASGADASINRWQPIETQETRQMRMNEEMEKEARQAQVELQARIQEYPQEFQEFVDQAATELADYIMRTEDQLYRFWQELKLNTEYRGSFEQFLQQRMMSYANQLKVGTSDAVSRFVLNQTPAIANFLSRAHGINANVPDVINRISDMLLEAVEKDSSLTTQEEKMLAYTQQMAVLTALYSLSNLDRMSRSAGAWTIGGLISNAAEDANAGSAASNVTPGENNEGGVGDRLKGLLNSIRDYWGTAVQRLGF